MAGFRTAYLQREVYMDLDVVGDVKVGDCVQVTLPTTTVGGYMKKATFANADYIVAQSDQTIGYGHVPVENRDYRYDPTVKQTVATAPTAGTSTGPKTENGYATTLTWKHVALFKIINRDDVVLDADGNDVAKT